MSGAHRALVYLSYQSHQDGGCHLHAMDDGSMDIFFNFLRVAYVVLADDFLFLPSGVQPRHIW